MSLLRLSECYYFPTASDVYWDQAKENRVLCKKSRDNAQRRLRCRLDMREGSKYTR